MANLIELKDTISGLAGNLVDGDPITPLETAVASLTARVSALESGSGGSAYTPSSYSDITSAFTANTPSLVTTPIFVGTYTWDSSQALSDPIFVKIKLDVDSSNDLEAEILIDPDGIVVPSQGFHIFTDATSAGDVYVMASNQSGFLRVRIDVYGSTTIVPSLNNVWTANAVEV